MKTSIKFLFFALGLLGLTACGGGDGPGRVDSATVGYVDSARFGTGWNLDTANMAAAVEKLGNASNFSSTGTVATSLSFTADAVNQGDIDAALLSKYDIFFIGYLGDSSANAFTVAELDAMKAWVNGGGIIIATCDNANYDAVCEAFGYPSTSQETGPAIPTTSGSGHTSFNGSFGVAASLNMGGTMGYFLNTTGVDVLAENSAVPPHATIMELSSGSGTVILISDIDIISTAYSSLTAGPDITNDNDIFLGNLFEYLTGLL